MMLTRRVEAATGATVVAAARPPPLLHRRALPSASRQRRQRWNVIGGDDGSSGSNSDDDDGELSGQYRSRGQGQRRGGRRNAQDERPPSALGPRARARGAAYYQRYLANRRRRGGEFLPPHDPAALPPPAYGNAPARWPTEPGAELIAAAVDEAIEAGRLMAPPPVQRAPAGAPAALRDRVADEEAAALLARLQARVSTTTSSSGGERAAGGGRLIRGGVVIPPLPPGALAPTPSPRATATAAATVAALPALPRVDAARRSGEPVSVLAFWDVAALHPGAADPRVVAARVAAALSAYGALAGRYAYAPRRIFAWVPEAFVQLARAQGGSGGTVVTSPATTSAGRAGGTAAAAAAAADVAGEWDGTVTNVGGRTLGRVAAYVASDGCVYAPHGGSSSSSSRGSSSRSRNKNDSSGGGGGGGRQRGGAAAVSLRYALAREGWEPRLVTSARGDAGASLAAGLAAALDAYEAAAARGGSSSGDAGGHLVVAAMSDSPALAPLLARARALGCSAVAVLDRRGSAPEADVALRWGVLASGRYYDATTPALQEGADTKFPN